MASVALNMTPTSGHSTWPPTNVIASSATVTINGKTVVLHGDAIIPHTQTVPPHITHPGTVIASSTVFIEGKMVGKIGDPITCGDTIAQGSSNVTAA